MEDGDGVGDEGGGVGAWLEEEEVGLVLVGSSWVLELEVEVGSACLVEVGELWGGLEVGC